MKRLNKIVLIAFVFLCSLFLVNTTAKAEMTEADLVNLPEADDITIAVTFDVNDVKVLFVSPEGKIYDPLNPGDDMTVFSSEKAIYIAIEGAKEGQWKIRYDKGSNSEIGVTVDSVEEPMWVRDIKVYPIKDGKLPVEFIAVQEGSERWYDYTISLSTDNNYGPAKEIYSGSAAVNEKVHLDLDFVNVNSHDEYYLLIQARYMESDSEYFDVAYSEKFSFTNPNATEKIGDYQVTIEEYISSITIDWTDKLPGDTDEVFVRFTEDEKEPYEYAYDDGDRTATYVYESGAKKVKVEVYAKFGNGRMSEATTKEISLEKNADDFTIDLGTDGLTNSTTLEFEYKNANKQEIITKLNNEEEATIILDGDGRKQLKLTEDNNKFYVTYTDANGYIHKMSKIINIDRIAPSLEIFESIDGIVTANDNIIITGKTSGADKLTINDGEVELGDKGVFKYTVPLEEGKNDISIKATDVAGNTTLYQAMVTYSKEDAVVAKSDDGSVDIKSTLKKWWPMIAAGACSLVGIVVLIITALKKKKLKKLIAEGKAPSRAKRVFNSFRTASILTFILAAASVVYYIIRYRFMHSKEFIELAYESVSKADNYMKLTNYMKYAMIGCISIWAFFTLVTILINVFMNLKKKPKKEKPKKQKAEKVKKEKPVKNENVKQQVSQPVQQAPVAQQNVSATQPQAPVAQPQATQTSQNASATQSQATPVTQQNKISFCPECGAKLPEGSAFCQNCGHKIK